MRTHNSSSYSAGQFRCRAQADGSGPALKDSLQQWSLLGLVEPGLKAKAGPEYDWDMGGELTPLERVRLCRPKN